MFPARYFAPTYFTPRYFPKIGAALVGGVLLPILYRRREFYDEWSIDGGATWVEAKLHQEAFQYFINADFGTGLERVLLYRIEFIWVYET